MLAGLWHSLCACHGVVCERVMLPPAVLLLLAATRSLLLVDYKQFVAQPEATVRQVLAFVGADTSRWVRHSRTAQPLPSRLHAAMAAPCH